MKTNAITFTKGNNTVVYFAEDLKLSAKQRAWLHDHGLRKDKWEANKYFVNYKAIATKDEYLKLIGTLYDRVLKLSGNVDEMAVSVRAIADRIYG